MAPLLDPLAQVRAQLNALNPLRQTAPQLTPEEEETLLGSVKNATVGGISAVGNFLDLPGSMLRDAVTLNNPLDQLATPFSSDNRLTGRDVLEQWGALGKNQEGLDFGDVLGFGAEVAFDPLTYLTFGAGALTKAGKIAQKAGAMSDYARFADLGKGAVRRRMNLSDVVQRAPELRPKLEDLAGGASEFMKIERQPLGGVLGVGLPFREPAMVFGGADGVLEKIGEAGASLAKQPWRMATSLPVVGEPLSKVPGVLDERVVRPLIGALDQSTLGLLTKEGQTELARPHVSTSRRKTRAVREDIARQMKVLQDAGMTDEAAQRTLRRVFEGFETPSDPRIQTLKQEAFSANQDLLTRARRIGAGEELDDRIPIIDPITKKPVLDPNTGEYAYKSGAEYFPRHQSNVAPSGGVSRVFGGDPHYQTRKPSKKGVEGGTDTLIEMTTDPDIESLVSSKASTKDIAAKIEEKFGDRISDYYFVKKRGKFELKAGRHKLLARSLLGEPEAIRKVGVYGNDPLVDQQIRRTVAEERLSAQEGVLDFLAKHAAPNAGEGSVTVRQLLKSLGLKHGVKSGQGAAHVIAQARGVFNDPNTIAFLQQGGKVSDVVKDMLDLAVPRRLADDILRFHGTFKNPDALNPLIETADSLLNLSKGLWTSPFASFAMRNLLSGQYNNMVAGLWSKDSARQAHALVTGGVVSGASKIRELQKLALDRGIVQNAADLTEEQASELLRQIAYADEVLSPYAERVSGNVIGSVQFAQDRTMKDLMAARPGENKLPSPREIAKKWLGVGKDVSLNPLEMRGVGGRTESKFGPVAAGADVNHYVEGINRLTPYLEGLKQGWDRNALLDKINAAQVNYSSRYFTPFEKKYLQRLFPFYAFSSRMIPFTLRTLAERPGGLMGQTIMAQSRASEQGEFVPDYVAESASIPIPGGPEGNDRYLTGFGLSYEDPLSFLSGTAGLELMSRTNPLIKAPTEWFTQQSFFEKGPEGGRPLEDLDPLVGRTLANIYETLGGEHIRDPEILPPIVEHAIANSPASRGLVTLRTLFDPRKRESLGSSAALATNLLSGIRLADISEAAQESIARERVQEVLEQFPETRVFERVYIPEEERLQMSPQEQAEADQLLLTIKVLADRAKRRAEMAGR